MWLSTSLVSVRNAPFNCGIATRTRWLSRLQDHLTDGGAEDGDSPGIKGPAEARDFFDILRELIDGFAGLNPAHSNLPDVDPAWWPEYVQRLEAVVRQAAGLDD